MDPNANLAEQEAILARHETVSHRVSPADNEDRNAAIEQAELAHWRMRPDRMTAYYDDKAGTVTTWRDAMLGTIIISNVYRHNFGRRFISIRVRATNGAEYYGRASYDHGQCVTLRRCK